MEVEYTLHNQRHKSYQINKLTNNNNKSQLTLLLILNLLSLLMTMMN